MTKVPSLPTPTIPAPQNRIPVPPGASRVLPPRTLTSLVPGQVRDVLRFTQLGAQLLNAGSPGLKPFPEKPVPTPVARTGQGVKWTHPVAGWTPDGRHGSAYRGFLSDFLGSGDILYFQFNPEEVEVDPATVWNITESPNRSHPFVQWGGGGATRISFTLKFNYTLNDIGNVADNVNWIQSFMLPSAYNGDTGLLEGPRPLLLGLGGILARAGGTTEARPVLLLKCPVKYSKLMRPDDLMPLNAEVRMEFLMLMRSDKVVEVGTDNLTNFGDADRRAVAERQAQVSTADTSPTFSAPLEE